MGAPARLARALALRFAAAGAAIGLTTATGDGAEAFELQRAGRTVEGTGARCLVESLDMANGSAVQVTVRQVAKALCRIDLLVAAPDLALARPAERLSDGEWSRVINGNLGAVFYACRGVAREMFRLEPDASGRRGRIVVMTRPVSSEDGAAYRAARAGVEGLVGALAREWADRGVEVALAAMDAEEDEAAMAERVFELAQARPK